jgi:hypothetical protein
VSCKSLHGKTFLALTNFCFNSFFTISGFLTASSLLRSSVRCDEIKSNGYLANARIFLRMMLAHYIRLTPVLVVAMLLSVVSTSLLSEVSVFQQFLCDHLVCPKFVLKVSIHFCFVSYFDVILGSGGRISCTSRTSLTLVPSARNGRGHWLVTFNSTV